MSISVIAAIIASLSFAVAVIWAGAMDLLTMRIRNEVILLLIATYAVLAPLAGLTAGEMGMSAALAAIVLICGFLFFWLGWIGGGDAKLASAIALWLGAEQAATYLVWVSLIGAALTVAVLQFRTMMLPAFCLRLQWITRLHDRGSGVPYGVSLASAALVMFPHTSWMKALS